jgi:hypothetical protein
MFVLIKKLVFFIFFFSISPAYAQFLSQTKTDCFLNWEEMKLEMTDYGEVSHRKEGFFSITDKDWSSKVTISNSTKYSSALPPVRIELFLNGKKRFTTVGYPLPIGGGISEVFSKWKNPLKGDWAEVRCHFRRYSAINQNFLIKMKTSYRFRILNKDDTFETFYFTPLPLSLSEKNEGPRFRVQKQGVEGKALSVGNRLWSESDVFEIPEFFDPSERRVISVDSIRPMVHSVNPGVFLAELGVVPVPRGEAYTGYTPIGKVLVDYINTTEIHSQMGL